ncbi:DNA-binding transcriptional regulator, CsgD family [Novosphingobium sp. CF614]|uniref:helix-turn-helix transcriptional regulator n=1 Tax=Novosphingobium sp. CF614 TaxID=1884364 RepID=UPI0008DEEDD7|nr:helix-turn-helix transcriptional regulator [Novosphingobium sp. CF614]SFG06036.1 DNA-binding transcriptional regulator, CsgD family [Novosphingobium sp. CF614]
MALTSRDETDLLIPLFEGMHENPRFSTFLARLRRRTDAVHASLVLRLGDPANGAITEYFAGADLSRRARELGTERPYDLDRIHYDRLRPGRVYGISELVEHDPVMRAERARRMARLGIADERVVRLADGERHSAWLMLARTTACSAADSALLSNLAPYVAIALDNLVTIDRERLESRMNALSLARTRQGWMAFDREARLATVDPVVARFWKERCGGEPRLGERLVAVNVEVQRKLAAAAADMAEDPTLPARPLVLRESPRIEALLMPAETSPVQTPGAPAVLALLRLDRPRSSEGAKWLAQAFDLPLREAELAMALADGHSIAEAAGAMGLTLETARNYSKRLYAKLGVRGQAELVRLVYESSAVLA